MPSSSSKRGGQRAGGPGGPRHANANAKNAKGIPNTSGGTRAGNGMTRPGDWYCPFCGDYQFGKNRYCRMCSMQKPVSLWPLLEDSSDPHLCTPVPSGPQVTGQVAGAGAAAGASVTSTGSMNMKATGVVPTFAPNQNQNSPPAKAVIGGAFGTEAATGGGLAAGSLQSAAGALASSAAVVPSPALPAGAMMSCIDSMVARGTSVSAAPMTPSLLQMGGPPGHPITTMPTGESSASLQTHLDALAVRAAGAKCFLPMSSGIPSSGGGTLIGAGGGGSGKKRGSKHFTEQRRRHRGKHGVGCNWHMQGVDLGSHHVGGKLDLVQLTGGDSTPSDGGNGILDDIYNIVIEEQKRNRGLTTPRPGGPRLLQLRPHIQQHPGKTQWADKKFSARSGNTSSSRTSVSPLKVASDVSSSLSPVLLSATSAGAGVAPSSARTLLGFDIMPGAPGSSLSTSDLQLIEGCVLGTTTSLAESERRVGGQGLLEQEQLEQLAQRPQFQRELYVGSSCAVDGMSAEGAYNEFLTCDPRKRYACFAPGTTARLLSSSSSSTGTASPSLGGSSSVGGGMTSRTSNTCRYPFPYSARTRRSTTEVLRSPEADLASNSTNNDSPPVSSTNHSRSPEAGTAYRKRFDASQTTSYHHNELSSGRRNLSWASTACSSTAGRSVSKFGAIGTPIQPQNLDRRLAAAAAAGED